jgi:hypothetical protein
VVGSVVVGSAVVVAEAADESEAALVVAVESEVPGSLACVATVEASLVDMALPPSVDMVAPPPSPPQETSETSETPRNRDTAEWFMADTTSSISVN